MSAKLLKLLGDMQTAIAEAIYEATAGSTVGSTSNSGALNIVQPVVQPTVQPTVQPFTQPIYNTIDDQVFNEEVYLKNNQDVAAAVKAGIFNSGFEHYVRHGKAEGRTCVLTPVQQVTLPVSVGKSEARPDLSLLTRVMPTGVNYKGPGRNWPKAYGWKYGENFFGYALRCSKTKDPATGDFYFPPQILGSVGLYGTNLEDNPRFEGEWEQYADQYCHREDWFNAIDIQHEEQRRKDWSIVEERLKNRDIAVPTGEIVNL